ncbi:MAG: hypothetical protein IPP33_19245 [Flavobacteriales bacterium]|nr:hypothetical protein [Flavobacteriales bacterium]
MRKASLYFFLAFPFFAWAQQGWMPLGRIVDAPYSALMRSSKSDVALHSSIRPYAREDLKLLAVPDSLLSNAWKPWLDSITNPQNRISGGPLVEALVGASFGDNDLMKYRVGLGGWLDWSATSRLTFHVDVMGFGETMPNYLDSLAIKVDVTPGEGFAYGGPTYTHHDWNAYVDYKASKYFHFTLGRGKHFFGEGVRSLFLSDNAYSYPYLKITTTAWKIRYVNLFSAMSDIRGTGGTWNQFDLKFTSMHYLSWNALKRLNVSIFEAIVWQDNDPNYRRGFDVNYLNPVLFYRPTEFSLGSPDNALLGFAVNVRVGKHALLYSQLMFDEFLLSNVRAGEGWFGNKQGLQLGVVGHDAFKIEGLMLRAEFDYVRPFMYTHSDTRQNYAHFNQPLAHPYGSNFWEAIAQGEFRKKRLVLSDLLSVAMLGEDTGSTAYSSYGNNLFLPESARPLRDGVRPDDYGYFLAQPSSAMLYHNELRAGWLLEPRSGLMLEASLTTRVRTPERGEGLVTNFFRIGISANLRDRHLFQDARYSLE